jgi:hypothetical protein
MAFALGVSVTCAILIPDPASGQTPDWILRTAIVRARPDADYRSRDTVEGIDTTGDANGAWGGSVSLARSLTRVLAVEAGVVSSAPPVTLRVERTSDGAVFSDRRSLRTVALFAAPEVVGARAGGRVYAGPVLAWVFYGDLDHFDRRNVLYGMHDVAWGVRGGGDLDLGARVGVSLQAMWLRSQFRALEEVDGDVGSVAFNQLHAGGGVMIRF